MFISKPHGKESIQSLAETLGCTVGEALKGMSGYGRPGLVGKTFPIKDQLKSAGFKFDGENKAWTCDSWDALESFLKGVQQ